MLSTPETITYYSISIEPPLGLRASFWRRLWFLVSAVPRYLLNGSVRLP